MAINFRAIVLAFIIVIALGVVFVSGALGHVLWSLHFLD
jgi:hypothetical protein